MHGSREEWAGGNLYLFYFQLHSIISYPAKTGIWFSWPKVQIISVACCQVGRLRGGKEGGLLRFTESHQNQSQGSSCQLPLGTGWEHSAQGDHAVSVCKAEVTQMETQLQLASPQAAQFLLQTEPFGVMQL